MSERIADFCVRHIMTHGPSTLGDLADSARAAGVTRARDARTSIRNGIDRDHRLLLLHDERWDCALRILEGAVLTHRVRFATAGRDVLFAGRELAPLEQLLQRDPLPLAAGGEVREADSAAPAWIGPSGWLPDVPAGSLLALRWNREALHVEPIVVDPQAVHERVEFVRTTLARHACSSRSSWRDGYRRPLASTIWSALIEVPDLLAVPLPPLDEALALPREPWPTEWTAQLLPSHEGQQLTLEGVPHSVAAELERRADLNGLTVSEFAIVQLAAAAWHWDDPCRHDLDRRVNARRDDHVYGGDEAPYTDSNPDDALVTPISSKWS